MVEPRSYVNYDPSYRSLGLAHLHAPRVTRTGHGPIGTTKGTTRSTSNSSPCPLPEPGEEHHASGQQDRHRRRRLDKGTAKAWVRRRPHSLRRGGGLVDATGGWLGTHLTNRHHYRHQRSRGRRADPT